MLIVLWLWLSAYQKAYAQQDTLYVNAENTSYLLFDEAISLYNIGNKDYEAQVNNPKILFLKAKYSMAKNSTLVLTHGDEIFTAYLAYRKNAPAFYDFRKISSKEKNKEVAQESPEEKQQKQLLARLQKIKEAESNVSFATERQNMLLKLQNLYNDTQATYLCLQLRNQSSMVYQIDYVSFAYIEKRKKKAASQNVLASGMEEIQPLEKIEASSIDPNKAQHFLYAIPLYATTQEGYLQVIFREKAGLRSISLEIPFKQILNAKLMGN